MVRRALILTVVCLCLFGARVGFTGELRFRFLLWNVFLAWIPWAFAWAATRTERRPVQVLAFAGWLLFFPNSFYLVTDLSHLGGRTAAPSWFDPAMFGAFALCGVALAVGSLARIEAWLRDHLRSATLWVGLASVLVATGFGVWLGRVRRWNSWDVVTEPIALLAEIGSIVMRTCQHPGAVAATLVYSLLLGAAYLCFRPSFRALPETYPKK
jgi:uncharacterized membrane protein